MKKISMHQRFGTALLVGISGGMVALFMISTQQLVLGDWAIVRVAFAGAFLAGLTLARGFGRPGGWGWFCAGLSFGGATMLGAVFAVALLPIDYLLGQTNYLALIKEAMRMSLLGPIYVVDLLVQGHWAAMVWGGGMGLSQIASHPLHQS